ncbi:MAG: hypothetical protein COB17_02980 [Sulfurimonas sp.]|nr:MAG: hypothetical protein COB17_02980 [Sulfurimonas sp.]
MNTNGGATLVVQNDNKKINTNTTKVVSPKRVALPHINMVGYYQFVTFRTFDSLDDYLLRISNEDISTKLKQYKIDKYLDSSLKGNYLNDEVLDYLKSFFLSKDKTLYELVCFSIMPNHIHILFKQNKELSKIIQVLKGSSSMQINNMLNCKDRFWEKGYFDKVIRDEEHFITTYEYIKYNPIKANLKDFKSRFYGIYE